MEQQKKYKAQPEQLPKPTYMPFFLAFGIVLMFWGILTSWIISGIGLLLFIVALSGWILEIYKELQKKENHVM